MYQSQEQKEQTQSLSQIRYKLNTIRECIEKLDQNSEITKTLKASHDDILNMILDFGKVKIVQPGLPFDMRS